MASAKRSEAGLGEREPTSSKSVLTNVGDVEGAISPAVNRCNSAQSSSNNCSQPTQMLGLRGLLTVIRPAQQRQIWKGIEAWVFLWKRQRGLKVSRTLQPVEPFASGRIDDDVFDRAIVDNALGWCEPIGGSEVSSHLQGDTGGR